MKREKIYLTEEELEDFEFATSGHEGDQWELRGEIYDYVETVRTDQFSDGPSWDIVVKRQSDSKFFKWNCWDAGEHNGYMMESGDNYIEEVFPEIVTKTTYK
jgi:hypothetical protein